MERTFGTRAADIASDALLHLMKKRPPCEKWMSGCECANCVRFDALTDATTAVGIALLALKDDDVVLAIHSPFTFTYPDGIRVQACSECSGAVLAPYPCRTVQALRSGAHREDEDNE